MSVYKVYYNSNNNYPDIYCFVKKLLVRENLILSDIEQLFLTDPSNKIFLDIFSDEENNLIQSIQPTIHFLDEQINFDDTIETIKKK